MTIHPIHVVRLSLCGSAVIMEKNASNRLMMVKAILAMVMAYSLLPMIRLKHLCYTHYITVVTVVAMGFNVEDIAKTIGMWLVDMTCRQYVPDSRYVSQVNPLSPWWLMYIGRQFTTLAATTYGQSRKKRWWKPQRIGYPQQCVNFLCVWIDG